MPEGMIQFHDERGRKVLISRCDWAEKILPQNFQKTWDDADALYGVIAGALGDGFLDCVLPAIARLIEIDPNPERSASVLSIAQMKGGKLDDAERTLRDFIRKHGETGAILANLAKVLSARGDASYEGLLRKALTLDPNQANGLDWYALIHKERGGPEAYRAALEDVSREPGAWQPLLRLGQYYLEGSDTPKALEFFRQALGGAPPQSGVWRTVTGALGQAGLSAEMVGLCGPLYSPESHSPYAGLNLARGYLETGRIEEGRTLVERLKRLNHPPLAAALEALECEFGAARSSRSVEVPLEVELVPVRGPVWTRGLEEPGWLLPKWAPSAKRLCFLSFSDETRKVERPIGEMEDDRGRLSRALPLYLSEALGYKTGLATECVIPMVRGKGPVVGGKPWDVAGMLEQGGWGKSPPDMIVSGSFVPGLSGLSIELELWDASLRATLGRVSLPASDAPARAALELERELASLLSELKLSAPGEPGFYRPPSREWVEPHLQALAQLLTHVLAAEGFLSTGRLWNEPGMLESYYYYCEQHPSAVSKLISISGTLCSVKLGSAVAEPHRRFLLKMIAGEAEPGPVTQLSPLVFLRLGERRAFEIARERLSRHPDPEYRAWLETLSV